ncbi:MAG TPA: hypothetical protein VKU88_01685 [Acidimicrobiales bacterium]|nr:hypothetical protein [Acidimicrobiales bacterium]
MSTETAPPASPGHPQASEEDGELPEALRRRMPPVVELAVVSVALMLSGGVYLAAHLPKPPPLAPALGLLAAGGACTLVALVLLSRIRRFDWGRFFLVAGWALAAYVVIAALLAFVFVYDHTRGATLGVLISTLVVFALDVPLAIAYTVARYTGEPAAD